MKLFGIFLERKKKKMNLALLDLSTMPQVKQGTYLIDLRLTWREMENLIFGLFLRIFGYILEDFWRMFKEFWRNWFVVLNFHQSEPRLRISISRSPTKTCQ